MPRSDPASSLSSSTRAALAPTLARIIATDRGPARERNARTTTARTNHFARWCSHRGFHDLSFAYTTPAEAGQILAAYAQEIAEGRGIKRTAQPDVKTIQGYVRAAASYAIDAGFDDPRFLPHVTTLEGKRILIPLLQRVFDHARKWTPAKRPERQPITLAILTDICHQVPSSQGAELLLPAAIRDAVIIATFTGSRISEYAQSQPKAGSSFHTVPTPAAGSSDGDHPVAFERDDLSFYSLDGHVMDPLRLPKPTYVRFRFRFSKGTARAFTHRTFAALPSSPLCPVAAATRIIKRWHSLGQTAGTPLLCFLPPSFQSPPLYLSDRDVTRALRASVHRVYPSPNHILRQHISSVSSHSLRVFACLCLQTAGWDAETISHQLRWDSDAVKFYIRQSFTQIDAVSASLLRSAFVDASAITSAARNTAPA